jgi:hypothetical protein
VHGQPEAGGDGFRYIQVQRHRTYLSFSFYNGMLRPTIVWAGEMLTAFLRHATPNGGASIVRSADCRELVGSLPCL